MKMSIIALILSVTSFVLAIYNLSNVRVKIEDRRYGKCSNCERTWNKVDTHTFNYDISHNESDTGDKGYYWSNGYFPICEPCYHKLYSKKIAEIIKNNKVFHHKWQEKVCINYMYLEKEGYNSQEILEKLLPYIKKQKEIEE